MLSVVAIAQLGEAEAAHDIEGVDLVEEGGMTWSVQCYHRPTEQVELHCEFDHCCTVKLCDKFMSQKYILWILEEVLNGD